MPFLFYVNWDIIKAESGCAYEERLMIKVFLVEDEFVVREGIKNNVDWAGHGYEFCGDAQDGELAFPLIQKLKPDIVITDIKMPFVDGLELSRMIKKEFPWMEIIILSGFEDFEYAIEGIKIGVAQYLTKPIKGDDLIKEVDAIAEKIAQKKEERLIREKYRKEMEENSLKDKKILFDDLVSGRKSMQELMEQARLLNLDLSAIWYSLILLKTHSTHHEEGEYSSSQVLISERIEERIDSEKILVFDRALEGEAFLLKADTEEELEELKNIFVKNAEDILRDYKHVQFFGGIGSNVNRLRELTQAYYIASRALASRFLINESKFLDGNNVHQNATSYKDDFDISNIDAKQMDRQKLIGFLKSGNREETSFFVDEFLEGLGQGALDSVIFRQYISMEAYFSVAMFLEEIGTDKSVCPTPSFEEKDGFDSEKIRKYIKEIVLLGIDNRDSKAGSRYDEIIKEAVEFIEENYSDEDISLNTLASHVNLSPNHLSMIFSQQTGRSFIKYLTDLRMNKAKEMLKCTNKRSSEIGLDVGYKDPHYFSYIFKKTQGMTPTQFRGGKLDSED